MRIATVREVQHRLGDILASVERGEEITVTRRGKVVARIVPARPERKRMAWPDFEARMKQNFPSGPPPGEPASELIRQMREERS
jgi:prevent-host-death family protein